MTVRVGINGFGRIGRQSLRALIERTPDVEVVAVNDLVDAEMNALLFKHDSTYGAYPGTVDHTDDALIVDGREIKVFKESDPAALPWGDLGVDIVLESTGKFRDPGKSQAHLDAGAKKVIISAPASGRRLHGRPRRERGSLRPGAPPHHQQRLVHDELPRPGGQGRPRPRHDRARPDEHRPLVHDVAAPARHGPQGPAPGPRGRPEHRPDDERRDAQPGRRHARARGQVRRLQPACADADGQRRRLHGRRRPTDLGRGAQRGLPRGRGRSDEGHPRGQRRAARVVRLPRRQPLVDHRLLDDDGDRRNPDQGHCLVRQRVGLQLSRRRPHRPGRRPVAGGYPSRARRSRASRYRYRLPRPCAWPTLRGRPL